MTATMTRRKQLREGSSESPVGSRTARSARGGWALGADERGSRGSRRRSRGRTRRRGFGSTQGIGEPGQGVGEEEGGRLQIPKPGQEGAQATKPEQEPRQEQEQEQEPRQEQEQEQEPRSTKAQAQEASAQETAPAPILQHRLAIVVLQRLVHVRLAQPQPQPQPPPQEGQTEGQEERQEGQGEQENPGHVRGSHRAGEAEAGDGADAAAAPARAAVGHQPAGWRPGQHERRDMAAQDARGVRG